MRGLPSKLRRRWNQVTDGFWFLPSVLVAGAIGLALLLIEADAWVEPRTIAAWPRLLAAGVDGARALLETVASSMITVAGVVFSITLVALSLTSSQYSSRVLSNFMRDRANQVVLGVFVGIFAYCLVVLRTVRTATRNAAELVPNLAVLGGLLLGVVGILVLVFFIHHIAISIQASRILATSFDKAMVSARRAMGEGEEADAEDEQPPVPGCDEALVEVYAEETGYVQAIDADTLVGFAREHTTVLWLEVAVGDFATAGIPLLRCPSGPSHAHHERLRGAFAIGPGRTEMHEVSLGIRQMVDVALKALSPGINDTTTAVMAIDHLTALLRFVASRPIRCRLCTADGTVRVVLRVASFPELVDAAFEQIRQHAEGNTAVLARMLWSIEILGEATAAPRRRAALVQTLGAVHEAIRRTIPAPDDQRGLLRRAEVLRRRLEGSEAGAGPKPSGPGGL